MKTQLFIKKKLLRLLCIAVPVLAIAGCGDNSKNFAEKRNSVLSDNVKFINVAAPGSWKYFDSEYDMWPGLKLAVKHINSKGGINGKNINLIKYEDNSSVIEASKIARKVGDNPNISAAFICSFANTVLTVASLYEYFGVLMVAPATDVLKSLLPDFNHYNLIFQTCPDTYWEAKKIIDTLKAKNLKRIIIYNIENYGYGVSLANTLEAYAFNEGFTIIDHRYFAYNSNEKFFKDDLKDWQLLFDFDAIVIAGYATNTAKIIKAARKLGIKQQFITGLEGEGKSMLNPEYSKYTEGTYAISYFDAQNKDPKVQEFVADFKQNFGTVPDGWAAQCYGSMLAFAEVLQKADSAAPEQIADVWHKIKLMPGFPSPYSYAESQKQFSKDLVLKQVKNGKFVTVNQ